MILQTACKLLYFFAAMQLLTMFYSVHLLLFIIKNTKNGLRKKKISKAPKAN